jgi:hypothetical protein
MLPSFVSFSTSRVYPSKALNKLFDHPLIFRLSQVVMGVRRDLASLLPVGQSDVLQAVIDIEPVILAIATILTIQTRCDLLGGCCCYFQCFNNGQACVFNGGVVSNTCSNAEHLHPCTFRELLLALADKDIAWVVVPKTSINELDLVPPDSNGVEKGCGRGGRACDLPNSALV